MVEIVEAGPERLREIVRVNEEIFRDMYEEEPYSLKKYREKMEGKNPFIFICERKEKIVGDSISFGRNGDLYIWIIGVSEAHRGEGIGHKLLETNEQIARENFRGVRVKTYNVSRAMRVLLSKRGYQVVGFERGDKVKQNAIHYRLENSQI